MELLTSSMDEELLCLLLLEVDVELDGELKLLTVEDCLPHPPNIIVTSKTKVSREIFFIIDSPLIHTYNCLYIKFSIKIWGNSRMRCGEIVSEICDEFIKYNMLWYNKNKNLGWKHMAKEIIYIADDEVKIQELIKMFLKKEGYDVYTFSEGEALLKAFSEKPADMLILDVMMPGIDGLSLCSEIRKENDVPIIIISAKDSDSDKIAGLMLGSDDYMTKPFSPVELVLRVKKIFKLLDRDKEGKQAENSVCILDLTAYVDGKYIACHEEKLKFTPMEFKLLLYLMQNCNKGVSRNELLNRLWGFNCEVDTRATDDMIKRIRKKLSDANSVVKIETLWGFGFMIANTDK